MSLQVWLPLNGNLNNQGLSDLTMTNNGATVDSNGKIGSCYYCSSASYLYTNNFHLNTETFSVAYWVKYSTISSWNTYIVSLNNSTSGDYQFMMGSLGSEDGNSSSTSLRINAAYSGRISIPKNEWHHCCATWQNNVVTIYVDGKKDSVFSGVTVNSGATHLNINCRSTSTSGAGHGVTGLSSVYVNDIRIYDHCLSAKEVKEISKGLLCHYKLDNNGFGNPNLCPLTNKQEWTAVNANRYYATLSASTSNFGLSAGDTFTWSMYVKVPTKIKTLKARVQFYNTDSDRKSFTGNTYVTNGEGKISVTGTILSGYKEVHLCIDYNSGSDVTTTNVVCYYKMPKLEKGSVATPWCPHTSDSLYTSLGLNSTAELDCSGYKNDGNKVGNVLSSEPKGRYSTSTYCKSSNIGTSTPTGAAFIKCALVSPIINATTLTINWWGNIEDYHYQNSGILSLSNDPSYPSDYMTSALAQYDSTFRFNLTDGNYSSISSISLIDTGSWHMYTLVFNNGIVQGYRDGVSTISNSKSGTLAQFAYVYMGINVAGGAHRQTKSKWSDFRIYSTALSASDIKELYTTAASVDKNGNIYAYEFKEE